MKILYVENHAIFAQQVVSQFLVNHEVLIVPSLSEARRLLAGSKFDLALIDFDLDDGKGSELVRSVRKEFPEIKIIGVSSHDEGNQAMLNEGAHAICGKMDFENIEAVINGIKIK